MKIHQKIGKLHYELENKRPEYQFNPEGIGIMRACLIGFVIWIILAGIAYVIWTF